MKWNVYYYNINKNEIECLNIFDHWRFKEDVQKLAKKRIKKEDFKEKLRKELFYYFCSKCEYEILLKAWIGRKDSKEIKIDIYKQVMLNFDIFAEYVWKNKKELLEKEN